MPPSEEIVVVVVVVVVLILLLIMYSFICYFSRLEHIAHRKAKKQNIVKTSFREHAHTHTHTHTHTHLSLIHI